MNVEEAAVRGQTAGAGAGPHGEPAARWRSALLAAVAGARRRWPDALAVAVFLTLGLVVTYRLWLAGGSAAAADNLYDYHLFTFFFAHAVDVVTNLKNPFFTEAINAPLGVNMMANTSYLGMTVPLIPVTVLFGPGVSYALALTVGLAGTATTWYVFFLRHVTQHRLVAFASAAFCGFAPGVVGHGNGHPNIATQFMLPLIISGVIRLRDSSSPVRSGVVLGLMITYQLFLNEELLLLVAMACAVMVVVFVASRPRAALKSARRFLAGLGVAAGVAALLGAYPLWFQFFGPQHYRGPFVWTQYYYADLADYWHYGRNSLADTIAAVGTFDNNVQETNAFFGPPLFGLAVILGVGLWMELKARIAAVVALVFLALSLGETVTIMEAATAVPGPWRLLSELPLFDSVIVVRFALVVSAASGVLLAVAGNMIMSRTATAQPIVMRSTRSVWILVVAVVLVPLTPTPLRAAVPPPVPAFFTDGGWRQFVSAGTVVPVPPSEWSLDAQQWAVATGVGIRVADGYFLGPRSASDATARFGPAERPTARLLRSVSASGQQPTITENMRSAAWDDLRFWQADILVLDRPPHAEVLRATVDELLGQTAVQHGGVWVWDVRDIVGADG